MKKNKKTLFVVLIFIAILIIMIAVVLFDFYKFYKLETFSKEEIDNVCLTMSEINDGEVEKSFVTDNDNYLLCFVEDNDKQALFVVEKVYFHNIKSTERYKVKYEDIDNENNVSSLYFYIDEETEALIYFWNSDYSVEKINYTLVENDSGEATEKVIKDISDKYICIEYPYESSNVTKINFYDILGNEVYTEKRAVGREDYSIQN